MPWKELSLRMFAGASDDEVWLCSVWERGVVQHVRWFGSLRCGEHNLQRTIPFGDAGPDGGS